MVVHAPRVEARVVGMGFNDLSGVKLSISGIENFVVLFIWRVQIAY